MLSLFVLLAMIFRSAPVRVPCNTSKTSSRSLPVRVGGQWLWRVVDERVDDSFFMILMGTESLEMF